VATPTRPAEPRRGTRFQVFSRRARAALFWGLAGFAALQVGRIVALDLWFPDVRDPEYAAQVKDLRARRAEAPGQPLVLTFGSSRTKMGLVASQVRAELNGRPVLAVNFGLQGGGPVLERVCLERLLAEGIRPDLLLVEVLLPELAETETRPLEEGWLNESRLTARELVSVLPYVNQPFRLVRHWCLYRGIPGAAPATVSWPCGPLDLDRPRHRLPVEAEFHSADGHGWHPYFVAGITPEERQKRTAFARGQYEDTFKDFRLARRPVKALEALLDCCQRERVPVALVLMPEATAFRNLYPAEMRAALDSFLAGLSRERGVPVVDARAWVADEDFWDTHHLLPSGAAVFTRRLEREALVPLLQSLAKPNHE
jgi:hypothetical protein